MPGGEQNPERSVSKVDPSASSGQYCNPVNKITQNTYTLLPLRNENTLDCGYPLQNTCGS
jgi:hypothetical protein